MAGRCGCGGSNGGVVLNSPDASIAVIARSDGSGYDLLATALSVGNGITGDGHVLPLAASLAPSQAPGSGGANLLQFVAGRLYVPTEGASVVGGTGISVTGQTVSARIHNDLASLTTQASSHGQHLHTDIAGNLVASPTAYTDIVANPATAYNGHPTNGAVNSVAGQAASTPVTVVNNSAWPMKLLAFVWGKLKVSTAVVAPAGARMFLNYSVDGGATYTNIETITTRAPATASPGETILMKPFLWPLSTTTLGVGASTSIGFQYQVQVLESASSGQIAAQMGATVVGYANPTL